MIKYKKRKSRNGYMNKTDHNEWKHIRYIRKVEKLKYAYEVKCKKYLQKDKLCVQEIKELEIDGEQEQERAWQEKYIKSKAYTAIFIGVLMLTLTFFLSYICETVNLGPTLKSLCKAFITVLNSVISIIIGMGISTLVLDFFSYIKYTRNRIKEIMLDKKYIETLSNEEKRGMIERAEHSLYFRNGDVIDNSLYANIKELIIPLIEENYYKQYKVHVDCYVDEDKQIITKKVHKIMDIVCIGKKDFTIPFSTYMLKIDNVNDDDLYRITKCIWEGKDITGEVNKGIKPETMGKNEKEENMEVKFKVDYIFDLNPGLNRIEICTETKVPLSDNVYAHTITIPCQRYSINYSIHNSDYEVLGYGFAFDDPNHKDKTDRVIYKNKYDDCFKIRFESWTLPGDGVVFLINKKLNKISDNR